MFPELSEGERRLGQLGGFTSEQMDEFIEFYPLEDLGLIPITTGDGARPVADDGVVSTPVPNPLPGIFLSVPNPHKGRNVTITEKRARHILNGDPDNTRSGGHRFGTGRPNKTEFPERWTDQQILDAIREVARDSETAFESSRLPGQVYVDGLVEGVDIRVIFNPDGNVLSAYPLPGPLIARNPS